MIAIIGNGNVGSHLLEAIRGKKEVTTVNPRTLDNFPGDPEIVLIAVSDDAIAEVAQKMPHTNAIVAHTSGSVSMDVLKEKFKNYGVFYPLQTFTKGVGLDYGEIPFFIEGNNAETEQKLSDLALVISGNVCHADSEKRRALHLASVFACNFTNALIGVSKDLLDKEGIDFKTLLPLLKQTVSKLEMLSPKEAQTGPAKRGDIRVMEKHLSMLEDNPELKELYKRISYIIGNGKI